MKIIRKSTDQVYAYGTRVTPTQSLEEARRIITKFNAIGFNFTDDPILKIKFIAFMIETQRFGTIPIRVEIPEIFVKNKQTGQTRYLERESYRALILLLKAKLTEIECGKSPESVFLLDAITNDGKPLLERLSSDSSIPKLLAKNE
jgi:hypothetical protein